MKEFYKSQTMLAVDNMIMLNSFATGNTPVCGGKFEHVDNITVHIIQMKQSPVYKELIIFLMANNTMRCN